MTSSKFRGADALVRVLKSAGVRQLFTLSGNHVMPIFDAALDAGIRLIHTRHEAATVHMADAWARLNGEPGVALVTGGPGHANALSALYTAQMAESPVVLLSGQAPANQLGMGAFQEMRQADLAAPLTKASWTSSDADAISGDVARAMSIAASGRPGPVHLSLPADLLIGPASRTEAAAEIGFRPAPMPLSATAAAAIWNHLSKAKRPLILTGPSCTSREGRQRMAELEDATGIAVIGMESPRGIQDPSLGAFAGMLTQSDCLLLLGKRLDFTLQFGQTKAISGDCSLLQIDAETQEFDRTRRAVGSRLLCTEQADAFSAIDALVVAAGRSNASGQWRAEVREAVSRRPPGLSTATSPRPGLLHPAQALLPLQAVLDTSPDAVLVCDGGEFGQWAQACLHTPSRVINGVAGAIGSALPFALAARLARPDAPVIAVLGDGTFGFHAAEMDTAARYQLPFVAVVGNDARWNAEYQIQLRDFGSDRLVGCDLLATRYDQVTQGFGGHGEQVTEAGDLLAAVQRAMASDLPACLNVLIDGLAAPTVS